MARSRFVVTSFLCSEGARKQGRLGRPLGRCLRVFRMRDSPTTRVRVSRLFDPSWCRNPLGKTQDGPSRGYEFRTDGFYGSPRPPRPNSLRPNAPPARCSVGQDLFKRPRLVGMWPSPILRCGPSDRSGCFQPYDWAASLVALPVSLRSHIRRVETISALTYKPHISGPDGTAREKFS